MKHESSVTYERIQIRANGPHAPNKMDPSGPTRHSIPRLLAHPSLAYLLTFIDYKGCSLHQRKKGPGVPDRSKRQKHKFSLSSRTAPEIVAYVIC